VEQIIRGRAVPLPMSDIDTDQIIPRQFLKTTRRGSLGECLLYHHRYRPDGSPDPRFVLNDPRYQGAVILLAGENFGCGSSREHAVWALVDWGFKAVVAPSFAEIFAGNAVNNHLLPVRVSPGALKEMVELATADPATEFVIDLPARSISAGSRRWELFISPALAAAYSRPDPIASTLGMQQLIEAYEREHAEPWQAGIVQEEGA